MCICDDGHPSSQAARQNVRGVARHVSSLSRLSMGRQVFTDVNDLARIQKITQSSQLCSCSGATEYIWPGGHLYGSRLGNAGLSAFGTGPYRSFHETGGLLSVAVWTCQMLKHLHCSRLLSIFAPGIQNGEKTWKSEQKNPWGSISSQTFP